ncbi:hypothetical protein [Agrobacterium larrymoorei]|uniref:Uncharacterized protein n=1 Tax=Agrobacterium larrymoorei TaxID=160699 RepID=A0ABU0UF79_9HYPH|nr:hypothetical protein [Agrobacterium larrymoorei]MDQ1183596.1 hypothetical protein [Agrobacterium larrymoorei]
MLMPTWLKITAVGLLGAAALAAGSYLLGKHNGASMARAAMHIEAAKNALDRVTQLEKNNATFRSLTPRHRCLAFMRDSGLPDSACD